MGKYCLSITFVRQMISRDNRGCSEDHFITILIRLYRKMLKCLKCCENQNLGHEFNFKVFSLYYYNQ